MEWITPKINWTKNDFVNIVDINRIINNIKYLQAGLLRWQYRSGHIALDIVGHTYEEILDALNEIEDNIQHIAETTIMRPDYHGSIEQYGNAPFWDFEDLNRIERNLSGFYETLQSVCANALMLPIVLGGGLIADRVQSV